MNEKTRKIIQEVAFTIFLFSLLGGIYIVMNSWVHPQTLTIQLSHLTPWIREDTFGIASWITSFFSFLLWRLIKKS
jgi:hypothetical protein